MLLICGANGFHGLCYTEMVGLSARHSIIPSLFGAHLPINAGSRSSTWCTDTTATPSTCEDREIPASKSQKTCFRML